ncbi:MAG: alpha/beta hydrolase family protein, partial [Verrucomicrobiales bacterium]
MLPLRLLLLSQILCLGAFAQDYRSIPTEAKAGDRLLAEYFELETRRIESSCLAEIRTADDWRRARGVYREQLFEMLGVPSRGQRTPLDAEVTGSQQLGDVVIENLVFQSLPGLYVTANYYRPATLPEQPLPAILYVCGHAGQRAGGISFGNKTAYRRHGLWFANHGYICLTIDTIQLGEIEGIHHGTYREGRWWW